MKLKTYRKLFGGSSLLLAVMACGASAWAGEIYTYTSQPLTVGCAYGNTSAPCPPFSPSDVIQLQFTTADPPLGDNLVGASVAVQSWSLSVGSALSDSSATPDAVLGNVSFWTDGSGNIVNWNFVTYNPVDILGLNPQEYFGNQNPDWENPPYPWDSSEVFSFNSPGNLNPVEDGVYIPSIYQDSYQAEVVNSPGTWQVQETAGPEPGTAMLLIAGLVALGRRLRRD